MNQIQNDPDKSTTTSDQDESPVAEFNKNETRLLLERVREEATARPKIFIEVIIDFFKEDLIPNSRERIKNILEAFAKHDKNKSDIQSTVANPKEVFRQLDLKLDERAQRIYANLTHADFEDVIMNAEQVTSFNEQQARIESALFKHWIVEAYKSSGETKMMDRNRMAQAIRDLPEPSPDWEGKTLATKVKNYFPDFPFKKAVKIILEQSDKKR